MGLAGAAPGGGATTLGWTAGAAGAVVPIAGLAPVAPPGASGAGLAFGLTAPGDTAALGGGGGAPLAPGTGSALVLGKGCVEGSAPGALAGSVGFGLPTCPAPGKPALAAGLIAALGGTGALPCWISVARCATAGGSVGVAAPCPSATGEPGRPPPLAPSPASPATGAPGCGRRLMTLLMTALL